MSKQMKPAVVMELGAERCHFGFSMEKSPRASMLTLVGRPNGKVAQRIPDLRDFYVGGEAELKASILNVRHPMRRGMVDSWDDMVHLWRHGFRDLLKVAPEDHPVLLSEPPLIPPVNREKMTQVLFETFQVPAMYVALQQLLTLLSVGQLSGLVLDSGYDATYAIPVYDGCVEQSGALREDLGGRDLTGYMVRLLKERGFPNAVTQERRASCIKEELCYVALDFETEKQRLTTETNEITSTYQLPDGQVISICEERFSCPEALFQPSYLGSECNGIHTIAAKAAKSCTPEHQKAMYNNVVLAGGSTRFPGFASRFQQELRYLVNDNNMEIRVRETLKNPENLEPSAWLGGSILSSLPSFQSKWITRQEYDETGPSIVHKKCD